MNKMSPQIDGQTELIAHLGFPTHSFKAPMIYNPYFEQAGIDAVVVPMGVKADDYPQFLPTLFKLTNIRGALVTMPHKVTTVGLMDEVTPTAKVAGACNAVLLREDGPLAPARWSSAAAASGPPSPHRWPRQALRPSASSMPPLRRPTVWRTVCAATTLPCKW